MSNTKKIASKADRKAEEHRRDRREGEAALHSEMQDRLADLPPTDSGFTRETARGLLDGDMADI